MPGPEDQGLGRLVEGCPLTTVELVTPWGAVDSVPRDESTTLVPDAVRETAASARPDRAAVPNYSPSTDMGPFVPDVDIPATCHNGAPAATLQPALPFGPASDATQLLGDNKLGRFTE